MDELFETVIDINGENKKYPLDDKVAFFSCDDDTYFIYALYTTSDFTDSELIQVTKDIFINEIEKRNDPVYLHVTDIDGVNGLITFADMKSMIDNLSLGALLHLE